MKYKQNTTNALVYVLNWSKKVTGMSQIIIMIYETMFSSLIMSQPIYSNHTVKFLLNVPWIKCADNKHAAAVSHNMEQSTRFKYWLFGTSFWQQSFQNVVTVITTVLHNEHNNLQHVNVLPYTC